jgi:hypothetical protein
VSGDPHAGLRPSDAAIEEAIVKHTPELLTLSGLLLCSSVACQGDVLLGKNDDAVEPGPGDPSAGSGGGSGSAGNNATTCNGGGEPWSELLRGEWSLQPGQEQIFCVRKTLTEDGFIRAARSSHSLGTHSASLSLGSPAGPGGTDSCVAPFGDDVMVFASRAGTHIASLPSGQALPVYAGEELVLRVDVKNTSARLLSGQAIQQVQWLPSSEVTQTVDELAPGVFTNSFDAQLPSGTECDPWTTLLSEDWTIPPGSEMFHCVRRTLAQDLTLHEIQSVSPHGTHILMVSAGPPVAPDGVAECTSDSATDQLLLGSSQGTHRVRALEDRGLVLPAGSQLLLALHLVNTTIDTRSGPSLVQVR